MRQFVESLKRLCAADKITILKLDELLYNEKLTQEEYNYIVGG